MKPWNSNVEGISWPLNELHLLHGGPFQSSSIYPNLLSSIAPVLQRRELPIPTPPKERSRLQKRTAIKMRMKIIEALLRRETHTTSIKKASITSSEILVSQSQRKSFWRLTARSEIYYMKVCKMQVKESANSVLQDVTPVKMGLKDILASFHTFLV